MSHLSILGLHKIYLQQSRAEENEHGRNAVSAKERGNIERQDRKIAVIYRLHSSVSVCMQI
jgi:hypothetical protein